jgi:hypothetical protein
MSLMAFFEVSVAMVFCLMKFIMFVVTFLLVNVMRFTGIAN